MASSVLCVFCGGDGLLLFTVVIAFVVWGVPKGLSMGLILAVQSVGSQLLALFECTIPEITAFSFLICDLTCMSCTLPHYIFDAAASSWNNGFNCPTKSVAKVPGSGSGSEVDDFVYC